MEIVNLSIFMLFIANKGATSRSIVMNIRGPETSANMLKNTHHPPQPRNPRGGRYYRKNYRQPIYRHFYNLSVNYRYQKK